MVKGIASCSLLPPDSDQVVSSTSDQSFDSSGGSTTALENKQKHITNNSQLNAFNTELCNMSKCAYITSPLLVSQG